MLLRNKDDPMAVSHAEINTEHASNNATVTENVASNISFRRIVPGDFEVVSVMMNFLCWWQLFTLFDNSYQVQAQ